MTGLLRIFLTIGCFISTLIFSVCAVATTDSTQITVSMTGPTPGGILLLESGYQPFPSDYSKPSSFSTRSVCPANMTPYIVVNPFKTKLSNCWMQDFRLCVASVTTGPNYYGVTVSSAIDWGSGQCGGTGYFEIAYTWVAYCYPPNITAPPSVIDCGWS